MSSEKVDMKAKLERSRQSARECRARKKLRYQYLEELVTDREKAVLELRRELEKVYNYYRFKIIYANFHIGSFFYYFSTSFGLKKLTVAGFQKMLLQYWKSLEL